jgi:hypothetical protein
MKFGYSVLLFLLSLLGLVMIFGSFDKCPEGFQDCQQENFSCQNCTQCQSPELSCHEKLENPGSKIWHLTGILIFISSQLGWCFLSVNFIFWAKSKLISYARTQDQHLEL